jgi:hypothetical protein
MDVDPPFWAARRPHAYAATREAAMAMFGKSPPFDRLRLLSSMHARPDEADPRGRKVVTLDFRGDELFFGSCRKLHNARAIARLIAFDQRLNVLGPELECDAFLGGIARPIVNAGDASLVSADVVEHSLNTARLYVELGHARRHGAPHVVETPWTNGQWPIECSLFRLLGQFLVKGSLTWTSLESRRVDLRRHPCAGRHQRRNRVRLALAALSGSSPRICTAALHAGCHSWCGRAEAQSEPSASTRVTLPTRGFSSISMTSDDRVRRCPAYQAPPRPLRVKVQVLVDE